MGILSQALEPCFSIQLAMLFLTCFKMLAKDSVSVSTVLPLFSQSALSFLVF